MDFLVKNNIIKKSKTIIDIGTRFIKIISVHYANKKIDITASCKIDSTPYFFDSEMTNIPEFANAVLRTLSKNRISKTNEISVSLPSNVVSYRIVDIKNIKANDLDKVILKDYANFNKVSELTHCIDWAYLGEREENGEMSKYCLVAAVNKSFINNLIAEFESKKLRISSVSFPIYNLISLADLYCNDYDNINKMFIDFGATSTRIIVTSNGVAVYSRDINVGFNSFVDEIFREIDGISIPDIAKLLSDIGTAKGIENEYFSELKIDKSAYYTAVNEITQAFSNEIIRIIKMCESEKLTITKIIFSGAIINGLCDSLGNSCDIAVDIFDLGLTASASGSSYIINADKVSLDSTYNGAIGLAINTLL